MPRKGARSHRSEELRVITRLEWELRQRDLSYAELAQLMTEQGHPTNPTAIHRLLHGSPRRRLTVNEAAALADVFGVTLNELLIEQDVLLGRQANVLLRELQDASRDLATPLRTYRDVLGRLSAFIEEGEAFDGAAESVTAALDQAISELGRLHEDAVDEIYGIEPVPGRISDGWLEGPEQKG